MTTNPPDDDDGYRLWLRYEPIADADLRASGRATLGTVALPDGSPGSSPASSPMLAAARDELAVGLRGLFGVAVQFSDGANAGLVVRRTTAFGAEGFAIRSTGGRGGRPVVALEADTDTGVLYGVFHLLRHLQMGRSLDGIDTARSPRMPLRMLDHWDNLDGTIERGHAGQSLWDWTDLPDHVSPRLRDYGRANASVGINAVALNNVNADARILGDDYLPKVAALADALRPWAIRVFLSARFSAPIELDGLPTADPRDPRVARWWFAKTAEIYQHVPDFGGFLVEAGSEGQPGPQASGPTHAENANLLADALAPRGGIVLWRAFGYRADRAQDRAKQACRELLPLDGRFRPNVLLQTKNGPFDFQAREPFHPLFGAMPKTPMLLELQLTQEYLGSATHLAYLAPSFEETLAADTYAAGPGSTVARVVDGSLFGHPRTGMAAVANVGSDRNWCGHPFAQANWYAFGRLAWDHTLGADAIADEWVRLTFSNDERFVAPVKAMMLTSREAVVDYMTPLGLDHLMAKDPHHGPGPWAEEGRRDWTSVYHHRADTAGIGFDRTATGSDAVSLYRSPLREQLADPVTCPETLLLSFHRLRWDHRLGSGRPLWDELCHRYSAGVNAVTEMRRIWEAASPFVDGARFEHVRALLAVQEQEARWWRNACLLYFQTFSGLPLPAGLAPLEGTLAEFRARDAND